MWRIGHRKWFHRPRVGVCRVLRPQCRARARSGPALCPRNGVAPVLLDRWFCTDVRRTRKRGHPLDSRALAARARGLALSCCCTTSLINNMPCYSSVTSVGDRASYTDTHLDCRFMKVRLDRVLFVEVEGSKDEVTKCGAAVPEFERLDKQETWRAPYSPYAPGWWNVFMPGAIKE